MTDEKTSKSEELTEAELDKVTGGGKGAGVVVKHWGDPHENVTADDAGKTKGITGHAGSTSGF